MTLPLLIGESNPYSRAAEHALLPWPTQASGKRLANFLGLSDREYLLAFDRCNLIIAQPGRWSIVEARDAAIELIAQRPRGTLILLGRKVAAAFEPMVGHPLPLWANIGRYRVAPHPSGLSRVWADPDAPRRLRALLSDCLPATPEGTSP